MSIRFGVSPIAWANDDMPELGGDTPLASILQDIKELGFEGMLQPLKVSCSDHEGTRAGRIQQTVTDPAELPTQHTRPGRGLPDRPTRTRPVGRDPIDVLRPKAGVRNRTQDGLLSEVERRPMR